MQINHNMPDTVLVDVQYGWKSVNRIIERTKITGVTETKYVELQYDVELQYRYNIRYSGSHEVDEIGRASCRERV